MILRDIFKVNLRQLIVASLGLAVIGLTPIYTVPVSAVEQDASAIERITLSPSSTSIEIAAGDSTSGSMKVVNDGDTAYGFSVYARPYGVTNEQYNPDFTNQQANAGVYKWVQFDQTKYQVKPGESVEVKYIIRVPADATPGGHYGVLFAETDEQAIESTGVARKKRVGNLLYVTVKGEYKTSGVFKEFILPFWQTSAPAVSSARIENTGNVDFRAKVSTTAKDLFGGTKFSYSGDPIVLPGTTRLVEMQWEKAPNFGLFKIDQSVQFLGQTHKNGGYVLIAPRWAPVVLIVLVSAGAAYAVLQRRNTRR